MQLDKQVIKMTNWHSKFRLILDSSYLQMNMWNLNVSPDAWRKMWLGPATVHDFMYDPVLQKYDTQVPVFPQTGDGSLLYRRSA